MHYYVANMQQVLQPHVSSRPGLYSTVLGHTWEQESRKLILLTGITFRKIVLR